MARGDISGPRKDNCLIAIPDTSGKPGTHVVGRNALCMRDKPCPIGAKMVVGPIRIWEDDPGMRSRGERGFNRPVWCIRCTARGELSVNLNAQGRINGIIGPPLAKSHIETVRKRIANDRRNRGRTRR